MICQEAIDIIKQEESGGQMHLEPYQDVAGVWTIGFGHTGELPPGVFSRRKRTVRDLALRGQRIDEQVANSLLAYDLHLFEEGVRKAVKVAVTENQVGALVSLAFNIGLGRFRGSTLLRLLNSGDYDGAAWEFRKWRRSGGKIRNGLLTRRGREEQLFRMDMTARTRPAGAITA